jgi:hypothetical protein
MRAVTNFWAYLISWQDLPSSSSSPAGNAVVLALATHASLKLEAVC